MATTPTTPTTQINPKKLRSRIKKQIPDPKQHKWTQIGAKAMAGDEGALARLTKRGLIGAKPSSSGKGGGGKGGGKNGSTTPDTPKASASTEQAITGYTPPSITSASLEAKSPKVGAAPGTRRDAITGLDVSVNYGANPYHPAGEGTAASTLTPPKDPDIASQPPARRRTIKRLGKHLQKAKKAGDDEKVKKIRKHLRQLRDLKPGESLPKPTIPQLAKQKKSAKKKGQGNEVERLSGQIQKLRRRARGETLVKGTGKNKGAAFTSGIGIAGQAKAEKKPQKKAKK